MTKNDLTLANLILDVLVVADGVPVPTMDVVAQVFGRYNPIVIMETRYVLDCLESWGRVKRVPDPDGRNADYWTID